jgi:hypothetical protein
MLPAPVGTAGRSLNAPTRFFHNLFSVPLLLVNKHIEAAADKNHFVAVWPRNLFL